MQVVILCGGKGVRIREVNADLPKPMLPIGDRPILWHIMERYASFGFKEFILCLGYKSWAIKEYFLNHKYIYSDCRIRLGTPSVIETCNHRQHDSWEIILAETGAETMTGGRLKCVEPYLQGDHFMLTYGDGLSDINIQSLRDYHLRQDTIGTVTAITPPSRFGELEISNTGIVHDFQEKPLLSRGRINGGFCVFRRDFLDRLPNNPDLVLEQAPMRDLANQGELSAFVHDGFWQCMDNSRDYLYLNGLWDSGNAPWVSVQSVQRRSAA